MRSSRDFLSELEAAVRRADRGRAAELSQMILQCLAMETAEHASVELRVRLLLSELNTPQEQFDTMVEQEIRPGTRSIGIASSELPEPRFLSVYSCSASRHDRRTEFRR